MFRTAFQSLHAVETSRNNVHQSLSEFLFSWVQFQPQFVYVFHYFPLVNCRFVEQILVLLLLILFRTHQLHVIQNVEIRGFGLTHRWRHILLQLFNLYKLWLDNSFVQANIQVEYGILFRSFLILCKCLSFTLLNYVFKFLKKLTYTLFIN
jgi:hypothetical protein